MDDIALKLAVIGFAGFTAQWIAWRIHIPAIALFLVLGLLLGPVTGYIQPDADFGEAYRPVISLCVAIILFEGGLTLHLSEIREMKTAIRRIILISGPLVLVMGTFAGIFVGGLSWQTALVLGSILVVTGPTVIMPLLRQARLKSRPAALLRWEAIINDPIGALFAVIAFEFVTFTIDPHGMTDLAAEAAGGLMLAILGGYFLGKVLIFIMARGLIPEYLKAPALLTTALLSCVGTNMLLHEAGLLTVTIFGLTLANSRLASLNEVRRFKETITTILVSAVFIMLTASLQRETLQDLGMETVWFVLAIMFVVRPIAIFIATFKSELSWQEKLLVAWIAPRGIVAVAVAGLFAAQLQSKGIEDANKMLAYTFAVVVSTIVLHGFSLPILARLLNLRSSARPGILIIGGSQFSAELAREIADMEIPVLVADANWNHLRAARDKSIPFFYGDVLTEDAHHHIEMNGFSYLLATTDNDSYNTLVCTDFAHEFGRHNVFQLGDRKGEKANQNLHFTLGGRLIFSSGLDFWEVRENLRNKWDFTTTELTENYTYEDFVKSRPEADVIFWQNKNDELVFAGGRDNINPPPGSKLVSFGPKREGNGQSKAEQKSKADQKPKAEQKTKPDQNGGSTVPA